MKEVLELKCPLCSGLMTVYPDTLPNSGSRGGFRVQCDNPCDPQCHENVYGHGGNAKEAYAVACEKFKKVR